MFTNTAQPVLASNAESSTDTSGRLTGATSYVSSTGFSNGFLTGDSNTSFASADLASGELRAGVLSDSSGAGYVAGQAYAEMHDIVTLNVAGADAGTRTRVTVQYAVDGTYASSGPMPGGNLPIVLVEASFCLGNPSSLGCVQPDYGLHARAVAQWNPNVPSTVVPTLIGAENSFNLATGLNGSGSWEGSTAERMVFTGSFDIIGASITLNPTMVLNLNCSLASCDFGHTAQFRFIDLPSHVTYSSDSGVFLTAVPEPGTWALMLAGLGAVGSLARRRQGRQR